MMRQALTITLMVAFSMFIAVANAGAANENAGDNGAQQAADAQAAAAQQAADAQAAAAQQAADAQAAAAAAQAAAAQQAADAQAAAAQAAAAQQAADAQAAADAHAADQAAAALAAAQAQAAATAAAANANANANANPNGNPNEVDKQVDAPASPSGDDCSNLNGKQHLPEEGTISNGDGTCTSVPKPDVVRHVAVAYCQADNGSGNGFWHPIAPDNSQIISGNGTTSGVNAWDIVPAFSHVVDYTWDGGAWVPVTFDYPGQNLGDNVRTFSGNKPDLPFNGSALLNNGCNAPTTPAQCPDGTTGVPPACVTPPTCPAGTTGTFPACLPIIVDTCPAGTVADGHGNCVVDVCPNLDEIQLTVPNGKVVNVDGNCVDFTPDCVAPAYLDEHSNHCVINICHANGNGGYIFLEGMPLAALNGHFNANHHPGEDIIGVASAADCVQAPPECPDGQVQNDDGVCVPVPPSCPEGTLSDADGDGVLDTCTPTDVCPNIAGPQVSVPLGNVLDAQGNCVIPDGPLEPATCPDDQTWIDVNANDVVDDGECHLVGGGCPAGTVAVPAAGGGTWCIADQCPDVDGIQITTEQCAPQEPADNGPTPPNGGPTNPKPPVAPAHHGPSPDSPDSPDSPGIAKAEQVTPSKALPFTGIGLGLLGLAGLGAIGAGGGLRSRGRRHEDIVTDA